MLLKQQIGIEVYFFICLLNESSLLTSTGKAMVCPGTAASRCPVLYCFVDLEGDRVRSRC